ncbi:MAG: hypothetical protein IPJ69_14595 [Deltaproteobacteria bacterium]|nr:MAG: hypothetical protein IPJ69_14595 [Deltaproteobacteria bacterium]
MRELGATPLPEEYEERVKRIAGRIERHLLKFHPEIFNPDNVDKLARVSRNPQYQVALADVFPARHVDVDPSLPVDQWNPVRVRRGLDDRPAAWELIKATLEGLLDQPVDTTQSEAVFDVYEAFSLREIDQDAKLSQHGDEIKNIWKMAQERKKEMSTEKVKTALTLYGSAVRILSRAEKKIVEETLQVPAIAWAFERVEPLLVAGSDFDEGSVRLWKSVLAAPTRADAVRKRELFVTVLADERFPLVVRRQAALGLARGSRRGPVLEHLIEGYVSAKNENTEKDFYTLLIEYWQRVGELPPDDHALLFLQEEGLKNPSSFWQQFDRALSSGSANSLTTFDLELRAINHGSLSLRFIDEIERWSARPMAKQQGITFLAEFEALFPTAEAKHGAKAIVAPMIAAIRDHHLTRTEHLDLLKLKLPEVFMTLPAELRYAAGRYFHHLPEDRRDRGR